MTSLVSSPPATGSWARPRTSSQCMRWELQPCPGFPVPPSQCSQSTALFLYFPPSLLSFSLRYLTLGRNVRRRNMSTQELWVFPKALALPRSFCFHSHRQMLGVQEGCGHRLLEYSNVGHKIAPLKLIFCFLTWEKLNFTVAEFFFKLKLYFPI